jgi:hypothetical protein
MVCAVVSLLMSLGFINRCDSYAIKADVAESLANVEIREEQREVRAKEEYEKIYDSIRSTLLEIRASRAEHAEALRDINAKLWQIRERQ